MRVGHRVIGKESLETRCRYRGAVERKSIDIACRGHYIGVEMLRSGTALRV